MWQRQRRKARRKGAKVNLHKGLISIYMNYFLLSEKTIMIMRMLAKGGMKGKFS